MFDVSEVRGGESNDNTEDNDAFQQETIVDVVPINVEDNIIEYCMGDVKTEVVFEGGLQETLIKMKSMTYLMLILIWIMICKVSSNCIYLFCVYLELDMDIDVVICYDELVAIVFKFYTCELLDMDNGVDNDM